MTFIQKKKKPPKRELAKKYKTKGIKALAKEYNVSGHMITKWLYSDGITRREPYASIRGSIPNSVFAPILKKLLDDYKMWAHVGRDSESSANSGKHSQQVEVDKYTLKSEVISDLTKDTPLYVSSRRITAIIKDEQPNVAWETVDRLLCALHAPFLWQMPPLRDYYWENCEKPDDWEGHEQLLKGLAALARENHRNAQVAAR